MKTSFITSTAILALLALAPAGHAGLTTDPLGNAPVKAGTVTQPQNPQGLVSDTPGLTSDTLGKTAKPKPPTTVDLLAPVSGYTHMDPPALMEKPAAGYTTVDVPAELSPKPATGKADILVCTDELDAEGNILASHGEVITLGVPVKDGRITGSFALPAFGTTPAERAARIVTIGYRTGMEMRFRLLMQRRESELNTSAVLSSKVRSSGHTLEVQVTANAPRALSVIANLNSKLRVEIRDLSKPAGWSLLSETPVKGRIAEAALPGLKGTITGDAGDDITPPTGGAADVNRVCGGADDDQLCGGADDDQIAGGNHTLVDTTLGQSRTLRVMVR